MTIVAAVKSRDCLVLGTDSMTQVMDSDQQGRPQVLKGYSNATKLFQLDNLPIGIATWGVSSIGHVSIGGFINGFAPPANYSIQGVTEALANFIQHSYVTQFGSLPINQMPNLGLFIGGYSGKEPLPELWEIRYPGPEISIVRGPEECGSQWRGAENPFSRLYYGADPRIGTILSQAGVNQDVIEQVMRGLQCSVIFDPMPIQDAIGFARYILNTTISFCTYEVGHPVCSLPIQLAMIVRKKGFSWVEEPRFHI